MNQQQSRRNFLKSAAVLPFAASVALGLGELSAAAAAMEPIKRGGWSLAEGFLQRLLVRPAAQRPIARARGAGINLFDLADFCAKQGFDGFDATGYYFPGYEKDGPGVPTDKYIFDLKRHAFDLGLGISGSGVGNNFTVADKAARAKDVQRIKNWVEVAAKLGAPVLRVFADTQMRAQTWQTVSNGATRDQVEAWIARWTSSGML